MTEKVLESLATAGPFTGLLGYICWVLWSRIGALETKLEVCRADCDTKIASLHKEQLAMMRELNSALRDVVSTESEDGGK